MLALGEYQYFKSTWKKYSVVSSCCSVHEEGSGVVGEEEPGGVTMFLVHLEKKILSFLTAAMYNAHEDGSGVV